MEYIKRKKHFFNFMRRYAPLYPSIERNGVERRKVESRISKHTFNN